jgi:hypothetical protein
VPACASHPCIIISPKHQPVRQFIFSRDLARIIIWRTLQDDSTEAMIATPGGIDCEVGRTASIRVNCVLNLRFVCCALNVLHAFVHGVFLHAKPVVIFSRVFGPQVSIESIARDVASLAGVSHRLEFDTSKADGQFRKPASCDVLMSRLPKVRDCACVKGLPFPSRLVGYAFVVVRVNRALPQGFVFTPFSEGLRESWEWCARVPSTRFCCLLFLFFFPLPLILFRPFFFPRRFKSNYDSCRK